VHYLGFGNKDEVHETALREVALSSGQLPAKEAIKVGFQCEAKYYVDSQFYTCSVTEVTPYGFRVLFDGYGNSEEVPYEYLRPLTAIAGSTTTSTAVGASSSVASSSSVATTSSSASSSSSKKVPAKPFVAPIEKPIKIPENLQILPTDSEAEKERKRKRLRAIKSLNRHKTIDNERNMKQNAWKSFQHNAIKKKAKGTSGVLSKRGTSIFASPETVDGRVGVVGSGQGMTAFQDARKKLKPSNIPDPGQLH
jgi:survival-of-motor-neuron-related-splicing factor 30